MTHEDRNCDVTRRDFLQGAAAGAAALFSNGAASASMGLDHRFEHGNPLKEFPYAGITLQSGPHKSQLEQTQAVLTEMNEDSLLRPFRMVAGLAAPGKDLGGLYSGYSGPETFGQWISALSRHYAATGDEATRGKLSRLLEGYARALEPLGRLFQLGHNPTYHYDKLVCGLVDAYQFAGVQCALELLGRTTDAAQSYLAGKPIDQLGPEGLKSSESYTIPENQFIAWQRSGNPRYLGMAQQYLADDFYFEPLARGENVLSCRHAYSHVNALCSAAKAYLVLGDEKYLKAAANGLAFIEQQSWVTGGWGPEEGFLPKPAADYTDTVTGETWHSAAKLSLYDSLSSGRRHFETGCGSYAHFKLTRYLLRITKDPRYGDSMERIMYNAALGVLPLNKFGNAFYYSSYRAHARKEYYDGGDHFVEQEWPCCSGTLPQVTVDYLINTYFHDDEGIFVNLYIPSTLRWDQGGAQVTLTQSGQYPLVDDLTFKIESSAPKRFAIRLRIPAWAQAPSIRINGKPMSHSIHPGTFATLERTWHSGDCVQLELRPRLDLKAVDAQHPDTVALTYGPIVLFAVSDDTPRVTRAQLLAAKQKNARSEWVVDSANGLLRLWPWWKIKDETYFTYLRA